MRTVLFCEHAYAFGILEPIADVLKAKQYDYVWFTTKALAPKFPFKDEPHISSMSALRKFKSDCLFIPGNYSPFYIRGYKAQVFHGLAGEKASHFKVRGYFDVYLTQGPYFTERFNQIKAKHQNFEVIETGWCKLDVYEKNKESYLAEKAELLQTHHAKKLLVFAPTHNVSMNCAPFLVTEFEQLASNKEYLIVVKFHDLTKPEVMTTYEALAKKHDNILLSKDPNISKLIYIGDLLISDTSSVVYEFILLDKPVLTFKSKAENILWDDAKEYNGLTEKVAANLTLDAFKDQRAKVIAAYHPYQDGKSSLRMIETVEKMIAENGVPKYRKMGLDRMIESLKIFNIKNR